jgi:phenylpropionate dioxygenase-like ring-hydroxylating dioxygenase large terminal subunit
MLDSDTPFLHGFWYLALPGGRLKPGRTRAKVLLGEPVLIGRESGGGVFALRDICPHRGVPLSYGHFDGREVTCCYHGWRFATDGRCTAIPSLTADQDVHVDRIKTKSYPCREVQGNIWVYFAKNGGSQDEAPDPPPVPRVPDMDERPPQVSISSDFPCNADHAAFGLMDPTHAAFIHTSWWWKKSASTLRQKTKDFEPAPLGWRMARHRLPPENRVYKLLGANVTTEITYCLPGVRIEHIRGDRHAAVSLTAITPLSETETEVHQSLYWTLPWLGAIKPVARRLARVFLEQDRDVVVKQQEGLAFKPSLMLVDDADTQAKWHHRVKREWLRAEAEGRAFQNPVKPRTLRWRS